MSNLNDPILEVFIFETNQLIDTLEEILLEGEKSKGLTKEAINEVFRCMHTIKGSSAMMSYENISFLTHSMEDLFDYIRENESKKYNWSEISDLVFLVVDFIKEEMIKIEQGLPADGDSKELEKKIRIYLDEIRSDNAKSGSSASKKSKSSRKTDAKITKKKSQSLRHYKAHIFFEEDCKMENIRAFAIVNSLKDICHEIKTIPDDLLDSDSVKSEEINNNGLYIDIYSEEDPDKLKQTIEETLFLKSFEFVEIDDNKKYQKDIITSKDEADKISQVINKVQLNHTKQNYISVNVNKLDRLLDLVGELVIAESMVTRIKDPDNFDVEAFERSASHLKKMTEELQDVVMSVRMLPIAATFNKMQRLIRDMSKKTGKEVELIVKGQDTEVDKNIIDHISDPLMHLIRNAVDHGIEDKEETLKKGKPAQGRILLDAYNSGGEVYIRVIDDGAGLDKQSILEKACEKGLINEVDDSIPDNEVFSLIMHPGFSTTSSVTEFSGRGVGMDVVKKSIDRIGGTIQISSKKDRGTSITLKIPLTLAIIGGMSVSVGNQLYIIPTLSIKETFIAAKKDIVKNIDGKEMIMIRGECYPVIRLHEFFNIDNSLKNLEEGKIVLLGADNKVVCAFVDDILDEQQIVFKPMPDFVINVFGNIPGISGCTIMGDGSIRLVLDVNTLPQK